MTEKEILKNFIEGIRTLSSLENAWHNSRYPDHSYNTKTKRLRETLEHCLNLKIELKKRED